MPAEQLYSRSNRELGLGDHAAIAERFHPDPFRTRQLSSLASAIVLRCANSREVVNAAPPSFYCFAVFFVMFFLLSVSFCVVSLVFIFRHDLSGHRPVSRIYQNGKGKREKRRFAECMTIPLRASLHLSIWKTNNYVHCCIHVVIIEYILNTIESHLYLCSRKTVVRPSQ